MGTDPRCPSLLADSRNEPTPRAEPRGFFVPGPVRPTKGFTVTSTSTAPEPTLADEAADPIPVLRAQIDALDDAILRLVAERTQLSRRIQTARMNAGGTRVELGRERVIMDAYRAALGPQGPALADAVLQVCRGAR
jgi:chorismate mutase